ncbi:RidA family protein [Isoptericola variabilis]|uniref:RidA family protein n=1 Tax=Isoptericola variabilis TaxID=139208 RepID=UPI00163E9602|nr:RidA family protein [Isoptericola variabilis]
MAPGGPGALEQTRRVLENVRTCLEAAGAGLEDVVKWTILVADETAIQDGLAAFGDVWPQGAEPPAITVAIVSDVGPEGALVEIEAIAAVAES